MIRRLFVLFALSLSLSGCSSCSTRNFLTDRAASRQVGQDSGSGRTQKGKDDQDKLELPKPRADEDIVKHTGFITSYNHLTLVPNWAAYDLTAQELQGTCKPSCSFSRNPNLAGRQASREDYSNSGWDKGHMVPKADLKWSNDAYIESHYFTNVCPQDHDFNAGDWRKLEEFVRRMANRFDTVFVICGPIFNEHKYGYLGSNNVAVPDGFFKAILAPRNGSYAAIGFIMDNTSAYRQSYRECACSIDDIEQITDLDLFYNLNDSIEDQIEAGYNWKDWDN